MNYFHHCVLRTVIINLYGFIMPYWMSIERGATQTITVNEFQLMNAEFGFIETS